MHPVPAMLENARRLMQSRQFAAAAPILREIVKGQPGNPDAQEMLGIVGMETRQFADAAAAFGAAAKSKPTRPELRYNLSLALFNLGRHAEAEAAVREAIRIAPNVAAFQMHLGLVLSALHRRDEAEAALKRSCELAPGVSKCWYNLGGHQHDSGKFADAVASYTKADALEPNNAAILAGLGRATQESGRAWDGLKLLERAASIVPRSAEALSTYGRILTDLGQAQQGCDAIRASLEMAPGHRRRRQSYVMLLNYVSDDGAMLLREHREYAERLEKAIPALPPAADRARPDGRLRVGIMSADLRRHACASFLSPVFSALDREKCELWGLPTVTTEDSVTAELRSRCDGWLPLGLLDGATACDRIREAGIHVLIECSGHTDGNRLDIMAMRPAPMQATYLGYPNTTGLSRIDYRIVDPITDPLGAEAFASEKLLRVPDGSCLWCFRPDDRATPVSAAPCKAVNHGRVTIGCFNNLSKITPRAVDAWAEVLRRVPAATMVFKNRFVVEPGVMEWFRGLFEERGVSGERINAFAFTKTLEEHLRLYERIDFQMDTFPYNGTTTTCESFWQGVPVVAVRGKVHAAKVSECLLHHVGLDELIAPDIAGYVDTAVALANDPDRVATIRASLRDRMAASALRDEKEFGRAFAQTLHRGWNALRA